MSESAKFECSLLLISGCRFKIIAGKKIELSEEFITLPIENGNEKMMVALSFKHVKKVEFLDNHEAKGAGLILHINDFMRKKLQDILDEGGTKLFDFKKQHSSDDALVIMDIVNSGDSKNLNRINNILYKAGIYHHNYIMKHMNSMNKKAKIDIPQFISIIGYSQWTAVFSLLGIDIRNPHRNAPKKCNFGTSKLETTTEFVWTIDNFSERKEKCGECLLSPEFISAAPNGQILKWQMQIYPNGIKEEFKDYVSLNFLCLINEKVDAKYQIAIRKSDGDEFVLAPMNSLDKFGNTRLIKRELLDEKNGCLDDNQLTIVCTLMVQQETGVSVGSLFEKSAFMDCKIVSADGKEISVHKSILSDRSPVFAAMFEHEMAERNSNTINIADMKMDVIEQMLDFIYSGKEPNMEEMVEDLLDAAEKYELKQLKVHCERKMIRSLGNANACESLLLANRYSLHHLRNHTINFIKMHLREQWKRKRFLRDIKMEQPATKHVLLPDCIVNCCPLRKYKYKNVREWCEDGKEGDCYCFCSPSDEACNPANAKKIDISWLSILIPILLMAGVNKLAVNQIIWVAEWTTV